MVNQLKKWTGEKREYFRRECSSSCVGLGRTDEMDRLHLNPYDGTRVQYLDPITAFPDKIDELLIALNKVKYKSSSFLY